MKTIINYIKRLSKSVIDTDVMGLSAQLAFFFLLSLFPFLIFLITLFGYLPMDETLVMEFVATYAPGEITNFLHTNISEIVNQQNTGLLSVGIIGTLWSASNGVNAITRALNRAYAVAEERSFFISRLIAIALTIAMIFVIAIALALPVFGKEIGIYIFSLFGLSENFLSIWNTLRWVISSFVLFVVLFALYKLVPHTLVQIKYVFWGTLFATVGWQLVSFAFSYYVSTLGNYSATYGSLGTVIILMIWFYISGMIIIIGGLINAMNQRSSSN